MDCLVGKIIQYNPLSSSSLIDLVAPGSPVTLEQIQEAVKQVESLGFRARVPSVSDLPFLFMAGQSSKGAAAQLSFSNVISSSESIVKKKILSKKFQHLKKALMSPDSEAVWCIRGGYGSQKLMPFLMKMKRPVKPKPFIGYSDATVLQMFLNLKWKWPVLHFPVLIHLKDCSSASLKRFQNLLAGVQREQIFSTLKLLSTKYTGSKKIISYLTGGNLTLIQTSIGTHWSHSFKNKILFLEDTGEVPYRLDRALWQMLNAGVFKGIKALILGDFIYSGPKNSKYETKKVFQSFADEVPFPVVEGVPCGHGKRKEVLPFMTSCRLHIQPAGKAQLHIASPFAKK